MRPHLAALLAVACVSLYAGLHAAPARAQGPGQPQAAQEPSATGVWQQVDEDGKVGGWFIIAEHGATYEGTIVKMFIESGQDPNPRCDKCSGDQKGTPWLGLTIIKGMERKGLDYENGSILDPRYGSEYHALMKLSPDGQDLTVRGYLGFSLLGQSQHWKRLPDSALKEIDPTIVARLMPPPAKPPARQNAPAPKARPNAVPPPPAAH
jgi:uncharacterized protein (DUF2147 family)